VKLEAKNDIFMFFFPCPKKRKYSFFFSSRCVDDLCWFFWCVDVLMTCVDFSDVLMCWCVDVLIRWCVDVLMCWCVYALMRWCVDVLMRWCVDVLMRWCVEDWCWCHFNFSQSFACIDCVEFVFRKVNRRLKVD